MAEGVYKLNLAFVANLFNNHPSLDKPGTEPTLLWTFMDFYGLSANTFILAAGTFILAPEIMQIGSEIKV